MGMTITIVTDARMFQCSYLLHLRDIEASVVDYAQILASKPVALGSVGVVAATTTISTSSISSTPTAVASSSIASATKSTPAPAIAATKFICISYLLQWGVIVWASLCK